MKVERKWKESLYEDDRGKCPVVWIEGSVHCVRMRYCGVIVAENVVCEICVMTNATCNRKISNPERE